MSAERPTATYTHGHAAPVLQSHRWRTVENSAAYLIGELRPGVFVYRTLDDCLKIRAFARPGDSAVVLGGGLLGLEAGKVLSDRGLHVTVVHLAHGLMNTQLDFVGGEMLRRQIEQTAVAVFGTQMAETLQANQPGGVDDLVAHLEERGFDIVVPPLRFGLPGATAFLPNRGIEEQEFEAIRAFARDLLEACVPAPLG